MHQEQVATPDTLERPIQVTPIIRVPKSKLTRSSSSVKSVLNEKRSGKSKRKLFQNENKPKDKEDIRKPVAEYASTSVTKPPSIPLSERQQVAFLLQLTAKDDKKDDTSSKSPKTPKNHPSKPNLKKASARWSRLHKRNQRGETPLHVASINGDAVRVRRLIAQGAEVNTRDFAGWTPLHEACNLGWLKVASLLIQAGADVHAPGLDGFTPLHDAAVNGHLEIVKLLLKHGADPSVKNASNKTPLDITRERCVLEALKSATCSSFSPFRSNICKELFSRTGEGEHREDPSVPTTEREEAIPGQPGSPSSLSTMRKNLPQNQTSKGPEKPTSPRLTLRFQSIRSRDDKSSSSSKAHDITSSQPKYQSYCVTMEARGEVYDFKKDDVSSTQGPTSLTECESKPDVVSSSSGTSGSANSSSSNNNNNNNSNSKVIESSNSHRNTADGVDSYTSAETPELSTSAGTSINGGRLTGDADLGFSSDGEQDGSRKRRKSNDCMSVPPTLKQLGPQRLFRDKILSSRSSGASEDLKSPKPKKRGSASSSDTESAPSEVENEADAQPSLELATATSSTSKNNNNNNHPPTLSSYASSAPQSPKVPPLKIVLPPGSSGLEPESKERKVSSAKQALPYVVNTASESAENSLDYPSSSTGGGVTHCSEQNKEFNKSDNLRTTKDEPHSSSTSSTTTTTSSSSSSSERCHRVTRSSHRMQAAMASVNHGPDCNPAFGDGETSSIVDDNNQVVEVHPRKRKLRPRDSDGQHPSSSSSSSSSEEHPHQVLNCYQMFLNIRRQVDKRRRSMFIVHPKPPQNFKDYLLNRCSYVLEGNPTSRLSVPIIPPPQSLTGSMKDLFVTQESERYKLRLQHLIEREKLVLSAEQEILRVHGRAARALSNQSIPLSACTILKDEEIYNVLEPEQLFIRSPEFVSEKKEDRDKNVRSRYNQRIFLSWVQDVNDKWEKIKESMLLRHHNEAESLHAVQKLDWEWKMKELGMCDVKAAPVIDDIYVPMVHVSDDFDLQPA